MTKHSTVFKSGSSEIGEDSSNAVSRSSNSVHSANASARLLRPCRTSIK
jgi:hypothetical protein